MTVIPSPAQSNEEAYISVDVETAGPIPGQYSILALGACLVDLPDTAFYAEFQPINENFMPEAMRVSGFSLEQLRTPGKTPALAMQEFHDWILSAAGVRRPVFVGFNAAFDWAFVNWYFHIFVGENPFGIGGVDIKAYYMGMAGCLWRETTSSKLPTEYQAAQRLTHNALDDALAQAEIFGKMLASTRRQIGRE